jgi:DNA-binding LacI/PurR family transcriptional regulator
LLQIQHDLEAAGNKVFFSGKSQVELHHDVQRIVRHVQANPADAWVVEAGSRGLLEWFAGQKVPAIALYGRSDGLPIARSGPDKVPAIVEATRQLIALGHQRIVLIVLGPRRKPTPGRAEQAFLDELAAHGIATGDYHLPDWEETPEGFSALLETLFRTTPPTALIVDETPRVIAAVHFFARHRIRLPEQVSLVSTDYDSSLAWCSPTVAHIRWNPAPIVRRIVRWIAALRKGNRDRRTINFPAEFRPGGSIGPAPRARSQPGPGPGTKTFTSGNEFPLQALNRPGSGFPQHEDAHLSSGIGPSKTSLNA